MDDVDLGIMARVMNDAQVSFKQIASELELSPETVRKRYDRMREEGMILQSSISVDFRKLGYEGIVILMIESRDVPGSIKELRTTRNVIAVNKTIGDYGILVFALIRGIEDLLDLVAQIHRVPEVEGVDVFVGKLASSFPGGTIIHRLETAMIKMDELPK